MNRALRERTHELMRAELAERAIAVILERGYDYTTADNLARGVGVSRATFFRYLGSKDEAIVHAMLGPANEFADAFRETLVDRRTTLWQRLGAAFEPAASLAETSPERQRERLRLIQSLPAVGAQLRRARTPQIEGLAGALTDGGCTAFSAHVLATASIAVLDQCWVQWMREEGASLRLILRKAFVELDNAGRPPEGG